MAKARPIPDLDCADAFRSAAAKVVSVRAGELFEHSYGVLDMDDIERVHDMRVATRRLRAVLEIFASCFPSSAHKYVLRDVKRLADALGERRDPDVQIAALEEYAGGLSDSERVGVSFMVERLRERQAAGNDALARELADVERSDLRGRLWALIEDAEAG